MQSGDLRVAASASEARRRIRYAERSGWVRAVPAWPSSPDQRPRTYRTRRVVASHEDRPTILRQLLYCIFIHEHPTWRIFHWRSANGNSIDFVIERPDSSTWAIIALDEDPFSQKDVRGLLAFHRKHPEIHCYAVSFLEPRVAELGSVDVFSLGRFLRLLAATPNRSRRTTASRALATTQVTRRCNSSEKS